jgi:stress-induced morphogen
MITALMPVRPPPPGHARALRVRGRQLPYNCAMTPTEISALIRAAIPGVAEVRSDDNTHFAARVVSPAFTGLRSLARHQLVYSALGERVGNEIHALSIEAYTPEEWSARSP